MHNSISSGTKIGRLWTLYPIALFFWSVSLPLFSFYSFEYAALPILSVSLLIFLLWIRASGVNAKDLYVRKGVLFYPFVFLLIANMLSLVNAHDIASGIKMITAWMVIFFLYILIINTLKEFPSFLKFSKTFTIICFLLSIWGAFLFFNGKTTKGINPFSGTPLESNHFAFLVEEALFFAFSLHGMSKKKGFNFWTFIFLSLLFVLIFTYSRGSWLASLISLFYYVLVMKKFFKMRGTLLIILALFIIFLVVYNSPYLQWHVKSILSPTKYASLRAYAEGEALKSFLQHPIIGVGIDNFSIDYHGLIMAGTADLYSRILVETGVIGFFFLLYLLFKIWRHLLKGIHVAVPGSKEQLLQMGFLGGFLANIIDFCFFGVIFPAWWTHFFIGIALANIIIRRKK